MDGSWDDRRITYTKTPSHLKSAKDGLAPYSSPERLVWAVERLDLKPADRVLEIGCGRGVAIALVCDRLKTGMITALDRSPAMTAAAKARNRDHIAAGRATVQTGALAEADFARTRFNKAFAVNVNAFWIDAARELTVIRSGLVARGVLHLVYEPPTARQITLIAAKLMTSLASNGFAIIDMQSVDRKGVRLLGVAAQAAPSPRRREPARP